MFSGEAEHSLERQTTDLGACGFLQLESSDFGVLLSSGSDDKLNGQGISMPRLAAFIALLSVSLVAMAAGQHNTAPVGPSRKVISRVAPEYPVLAHRMHMQGVVKLEVQVRPNGTVKSAKVLGGNPVFADAATMAVEKWKFEAAPGESIELVQVLFEAQ